MRKGKFRDHIPLAPGTYELRLSFVETQYGPNSPAGGRENSRVFDVYGNGQPLLTNFDILADAVPNTADVGVFNDIRPNKSGFLDLLFKPGVSEPLLSAIAIQPVPEGRVRPVRLVAQDKWIPMVPGKPGALTIFPRGAGMRIFSTMWWATATRGCFEQNTMAISATQFPSVRNLFGHALLCRDLLWAAQSGRRRRGEPRL